MREAEEAKGALELALVMEISLEIGEGEGFMSTPSSTSTSMTSLPRSESRNSQTVSFENAQHPIPSPHPQT